jgi:hypothetical protein
MANYVEISVRRFFTTEDGVCITPGVTVVTDLEVWNPERLKHFAVAADTVLEGLAPHLGTIRPMTLDEIEMYREDEAEEASANNVNVDLNESEG